jgi:hypothetical protein
MYKTIILFFLIFALLSQTHASVHTFDNYQVETGNSCPLPLELATQEDFTFDKDVICSNIGQWDILALSDGNKIDGNGYGCKLTLNSQEGVGSSLCKKKESIPSVTLYQHGEYGGYSVPLEVGDYSLTELIQKGMKNDDISSLRVAKGYLVKAYEHGDFSGWVKGFTADTDWVGDKENDNISSIRVIKLSFNPESLYAKFLATESTYPYFFNKETNQRYYLQKDIYLKDIVGYRFLVSQFYATGEHKANIYDITIDDSTSLSELAIPQDDPDSRFRLCVYDQSNNVIGGLCTDNYYGHTYSPDNNKEFEGYFYQGKLVKTDGKLHTFNYDESLVPDNDGEHLFSIRIYRDIDVFNDILINLSDLYNVALKGEYAIITNLDTQQIYRYDYQSLESSKVTLALTISTGLEANYTSFNLIEDTEEQLYFDAALHISELSSSDQSKLSTALVNPSYSIHSTNDYRDDFRILNEGSYFIDTHSHHRVKRSCGLVNTLKNFFWDTLLGQSVACKDYLAPTFTSINKQNLLATPKSKDNSEIDVPYDVGFRLIDSINPVDIDSAALKAALLFCNKKLSSYLDHHRNKRGVEEDCITWAQDMASSYGQLPLHYYNIEAVVQSVTQTGIINPNLYYEPLTQEQQSVAVSLTTLIQAHNDVAVNILRHYSGAVAQSAMANPTASLANGTSQVQINTTISDYTQAYYNLDAMDFDPLPNVVRQVGEGGQVSTISGEYQVIITDIEGNTDDVGLGIVSDTQSIVSSWMSQFDTMRTQHAESSNEAAQLRLATNMSTLLRDTLGELLLNVNSHYIIGRVYYNSNLIGITLGVTDGAEYSIRYELVEPGSLLQQHNAFRGAVAYLRSEVLEHVFSNLGVELATSYILSPYNAKSVLNVGFKREKDEL